MNVSPSRLLLGAGVIVGAALLVWAAAGPRVVALLDRVTTAPQGAPTTPTRFDFDEGDAATYAAPRFGFGDRARAAGRAWRVVERPAGRLTLETPEGSVVLGPITRCWNMGGGRRSYEFAPEPGDVVTFTRRRSRVAWPRFAINWLGGSSLPQWGRYVYHRLVWRKPSGAVLDVAWRDEQFLNGARWTDQYVPRPPVTTLRARG